jgi:serine acetyltransferase
MNATILPFVTIGERSFVGAGSVVAQDVPAGFVVAGNPARIQSPVATVSCPLDVEEGTYLQVPRKSAAGSPRQPITP